MFPSEASSSLEPWKETSFSSVSSVQRSATALSEFMDACNMTHKLSLLFNTSFPLNGFSVKRSELCPWLCLMSKQQNTYLPVRNPLTSHTHSSCASLSKSVRVETSALLLHTVYDVVSSTHPAATDNRGITFLPSFKKRKYNQALLRYILYIYIYIFYVYIYDRETCVHALIDFCYTIVWTRPGLDIVISILGGNW